MSYFSSCGIGRKAAVLMCIGDSIQCRFTTLYASFLC